MILLAALCVHEKKNLVSLHVTLKSGGHVNFIVKEWIEWADEELSVGFIIQKESAPPMHPR